MGKEPFAAYIKEFRDKLKSLGYMFKIHRISQFETAGVGATG